MIRIGTILCGLALLFAAGPAQAEDRSLRDNLIEVTGSVGYQFGGELDFDTAWANFDSAPNYGVMAGLRVNDYGLAVVSYHRQRSDTTLRIEGMPDQKFDVDIGYLQIGGELEYPYRKRLVPFFGMTVGAVHLSPDVSGGETSWFFAGTAYAGLKVPVTKYFGLRTQIRMLGTAIGGDSEVLCVLPGGCLVAADLNGMIQGDVTAGVYLAF